MFRVELESSSIRTWEYVIQQDVHGEDDVPYRGTSFLSRVLPVTAVRAPRPSRYSGVRVYVGLRILVRGTVIDFRSPGFSCGVLGPCI